MIDTSKFTEWVVSKLNKDKVDPYVEPSKATYLYFKKLSYQEQRYYVLTNKYLSKYASQLLVPEDKVLVAKKAAGLANKLNRPFINKLDRY